MKTITHRTLLLLSFALTFFDLQSQATVFNFNIPNDLCFSVTPAQGRFINFNVDNVRNECIRMYGANPNVNANRLVLGNNNMVRGARSSTLAASRLNSVSTVGGNKVYNFGPGCGEDPADGANVTIVYSGNAADSDRFTGGRTSFRLSIANNEIFNVTGNGTADGAKSEDFLQVIATPNNTATISITNNVNQGQVIVGIYESNGNPNPIALLDPKSNTNQSFTANKNVFVMPLIRPKVKFENGNAVVVFEVGDPEENGSIIVEEDE